MKVKSESVAQSSLTLDCSPPGSSVPGILQAKILEWVAIPFSIHACGQADRVIALESWEGLGPQDTFKKDSRGLCWLGAETLISLDLYRGP